MSRIQGGECGKQQHILVWPKVAYKCYKGICCDTGGWYYYHNSFNLVPAGAGLAFYRLNQETKVAVELQRLSQTHTFYSSGKNMVMKIQLLRIPGYVDWLILAPYNSILYNISWNTRFIFLLFLSLLKIKTVLVPKPWKRHIHLPMREEFCSKVYANNVRVWPWLLFAVIA